MRRPATLELAEDVGGGLTGSDLSAASGRNADSSKPGAGVFLLRSRLVPTRPRGPSCLRMGARMAPVRARNKASFRREGASCLFPYRELRAFWPPLALNASSAAATVSQSRIQDWAKYPRTVHRLKRKISPEKQHHCVWMQHGLAFGETWRGGIEFTAIIRDPALNAVREDSLSNGTLLPPLHFSVQLGQTTVPASSCCSVMQPVHGTLAPADCRAALHASRVHSYLDNNLRATGCSLKLP